MTKVDEDGTAHVRTRRPRWQQRQTVSRAPSVLAMMPCREVASFRTAVHVEVATEQGKGVGSDTSVVPALGYRLHLPTSARTPGCLITHEMLDACSAWLLRTNKFRSEIWGFILAQRCCCGEVFTHHTAAQLQTKEDADESADKKKAQTKNGVGRWKSAGRG